MNFLSRIFHGRVTKSRTPAKQLATDHGQPNSSRSQASRRLQSPDPDLNRAVRGARSVSRGRRTHRSPVGVLFRVKQEDEDEVLPDAPKERLGFGAGRLQQTTGEENHRLNSFDPYQDHAVANDVDDDQVTDYHDASTVIEEFQDNEDPTFNEGNSLINSFGSDEVIPSIESDDIEEESKAEIAGSEENSHIEGADAEEDVEAVDPDTPKKKSKHRAFLYGKKKDRGRASADNYQDAEEEDDDIDEGLERELEAEKEPGLLITEEDLLDYVQHKRTIAGADKWPREACRLYKLLYLRGLYPLYPAYWQQRHLDLHPVPDELFTPDGCDGKALLKPYRDHMHHHGSKAIRAVFQLFVRVEFLRGEGRSYLITRYLKRELGQYIRWGEKDIEIWKKLDYVSNMHMIVYRDVGQASSRKVVEACQNAAKQYRNKYAAKGIENYPRILYVFVIIQHIVLVMAVDTNEDKADNEPFPLAELDMSKKTHWLDSALGIAITVQLARESLRAHRDSFPELDIVESDPDA